MIDDLDRFFTNIIIYNKITMIIMMKIIIGTKNVNISISLEIYYLRIINVLNR